jgi:hypothetical protein
VHDVRATDCPTRLQAALRVAESVGATRVKPRVILFSDGAYEYSYDGLSSGEQMLLHLDLQTADDEELNANFRCAHSVKGGAATFGFADVAELTHQMETLLDKLRRHELAPSAAMVGLRTRKAGRGATP